MGSRRVGAEVLAETRRKGCYCEEEKHMSRLGLKALDASTEVSTLVDLAGGCTTGNWICPRLDNVRRRFGL